MKSKRGFTLIEILIALFIFTIVSLLLSGALKLVIDANNRSEIVAKQIREIQFTLLRMSQDISQTVNRATYPEAGRKEASFTGSATSFIFTHGGHANFSLRANQSDLQRTRYTWQNQSISREVLPTIDQLPESYLPRNRPLLTNVISCEFAYLDNKGKFHHEWPQSHDENEAIPRAVSVHLTLANNESIQALYAIPVELKTLPKSEVSEQE